MIKALESSYGPQCMNFENEDDNNELVVIQLFPFFSFSLEFNSILVRTGFFLS
jgi:hypothetical protein